MNRHIGKVLALLLISSFSFGASFNCQKAQSAIEHSICDVSQLSILDDELAALYKLAMSHPSQAKKNNALTSQRLWIKSRNTLCATGELNCLIASYEGRINVLSERIKSDAEAVMYFLFQKNGKLMEDEGLMQSAPILDQAEAHELVTQTINTSKFDWHLGQKTNRVDTYLLDLNLDGSNDIIFNRSEGSAGCNAVEVLLNKAGGYNSIYAESEDNFCGAQFTPTVINGRPHLLFTSKNDYQATIDSLIVINTKATTSIKLQVKADLFYKLAPEVQLGPELENLVWKNIHLWQPHIGFRNDETAFALTLKQLSEFSLQHGIDLKKARFSWQNGSANSTAFYLIDINGELNFSYQPETKNGENSTYEILELSSHERNFDDFRTSYNALNYYSLRISFVSIENTPYLLLWNNTELGWRQSKNMGFSLYKMAIEQNLSPVEIELKHIDSYIFQPTPEYGFFESL